MRTKILALILVTLTTAVTFAATYKVTPTGSVTTPQGSRTGNYYNNYSSQTYVNNNVVNSSDVKNIEIVMDFSGSMTNWVKEAKSAMSKIISQIPKDTNVGFRVFGQKISAIDLKSRQAAVSTIQKQGSSYVVKTNATENINGACSATKQVAKILPVDSNNLLSGMNSVDLGGSTPMVLALKQTVYTDFASIPKNYQKKIILITDGGENCGGDPCAFARGLNRSDIQIDVVLVSSQSRALTCLASETGGNFYTLDNVSNLARTLTRSMTDNQQNPQSQSYEFVND